MTKWAKWAKLLMVVYAAALTQPRFVTPALGASCVIECMSHWMCSSPGHCAEQQNQQWNLCNIRCKGVTGTGWGAIAYSAKDKVSGWSFEQESRGTAEQVAMQYCNRDRGASCAVRTSYYNSCGAVAADGEIAGAGSSGTKENAQQQALAACIRSGGKRCAVQVTACSGVSSSSASAAPSAPPPPRQTSWGAIAYSSKDQGAGWSQGKDDKASAEKEAMAVCAQRGKGCVLKTSFNKECGALAADRDFTGWATSPDQTVAMQQAMDECRKSGGTRCVLHILFCSR
jgi:hypothetical protein